MHSQRLQVSTNPGKEEKEGENELRLQDLNDDEILNKCGMRCVSVYVG